MAISVFDLLKIGIGPSSSHTVGPMRAAWRFVSVMQEEGTLKNVASIKAELFGSLGATGKGHGSDKAVLLGLEGELPDQVDVEAIEGKLTRIRESNSVRLMGEHQIAFVEKEHLILYKRQSLPYHPNGMRFTAYDA